MGQSMKLSSMFGSLPVLLLVGLASAKNDNDFGRLFSNLLDEDYKAAVIPRISPSKPLDVEIGVAPLDFDFDGRVVKANTWLWTQWTDFRLSWRPEDYNGLNITHIPASLLWTPDLEVYNSPSFGFNSFSKQIGDLPTEAVVYSSGKVIWVPPATMSAYCCSASPDIANCDLKLGSWSHSADSINILPYQGKDYLDLSEFHYSGKSTKFMLTAQSDGALATNFYPQYPGVPYKHLRYRFTIQSVSSFSPASLADEFRAKYKSGESLVKKAPDFEGSKAPVDCA